MTKFVSASLLSPDLLDDSDVLSDIARYLRLLERKNGWHYDLDIMWILQSLESHDIKPGSTILDAGAGLGILQFFLASRGFNIISLDYSQRQFNKRMLRLFDIHFIPSPSPKIDSYTNSVVYTPTGADSLWNILSQGNILSKFRRLFKTKCDGFIESLKFSSVDTQSFGSIKVVNASFDDIPQDLSCDAIVSLSVIEHCPKDSLPIYLSNLYKCLISPSSPVFVTTSINSKNYSTYNDYVMGYEFSISDIESLFSFSSNISTQDIFNCTQLIDNCPILRKRLALAAYDPRLLKNSTNFKLNVPYIPIGITLSWH